jgi:hypothetical protein
VGFFFRAVAVVAVGLVLIVLGIPLATWSYLHLTPARTSATVIDKTQSVVHKTGGSWKLYLQLNVLYLPADARFPELATIDADEATWDQANPGTRVEVAYVPVLSLRQFPLLSTTRLAAPLPPLRRGPDEQRRAKAVVRNISHILQVGGSTRSRGMPAWQPFDVIEFEFVPEGRTEPVRAADSVDADSIPGLAQDKPVDIAYSTAHPHEARITVGTQRHEWKNNIEVFAPLGLIVAIFVFFRLRRTG